MKQCRAARPCPGQQKRPPCAGRPLRNLTAFASGSGKRGAEHRGRPMAGV